MTGTQTLGDPTGSKRASMAAALEYGTHPLLGQHLYRRDVPTTPGETYDSLMASASWRPREDIEAVIRAVLPHLGIEAKR